MDLNGLITNLVALDTQDLQSLQRMLDLLTELSDPTTIALLNDLKAHEKIYQLINALNKNVNPPDKLTQHQRFLNRIERLSLCEGKTIEHSSMFPAGSDKPYFQPFDMIYVSFGGVGMEYDEPHYALVWEDRHSESEVTIIPTTSQYEKDFPTEFSIGVINGLPRKKTVLSVTKLTRVSRKRIIYHHGKYLQGIVPKAQRSELKKRIQEACAIWLQDYQPLEYFIKHHTGNAALPVDLLSDNYNRFIRFTPIKPNECKWDSKTMMVSYRPWNESTVKLIAMQNPDSFITKEFKINSIYDKIFQNDPTIRQAGRDEFNRLYPAPVLVP